MTDYSDNEGPPISIEDSVTPFSKESIEQVTPEQWNSMSVADLHDQLHFLNDRYYKSLQCGHPDIAKQLISGIRYLDWLISNKSTDKSLLTR